MYNTIYITYYVQSDPLITMPYINYSQQSKVLCGFISHVQSFWSYASATTIIRIKRCYFGVKCGFTFACDNVYKEKLLKSKN